MRLARLLIAFCLIVGVAAATVQADTNKQKSKDKKKAKAKGKAKGKAKDKAKGKKNPKAKDKKNPKAHKDKKNPKAHKDKKNPKAHKDKKNPKAHKDKKNPKAHKDKKNPKAKDKKNPKAHKDKKNPKAKENDNALIKELRNVAKVLKSTDADYSGHRRHALAEVQHAIHQLAKDAGEGTAPPPKKRNKSIPQAKSDAKMHKAKAALDKVLGTLKSPSASPRHSKAATHVQNAIHSINKALGSN